MLRNGRVATVVLAALVVAAGCQRPGEAGKPGEPAKEGPTAAKEGETWNHQELLDYLQGRGLKARSTKHGGSGGWVDPHQHWVADTAPQDWEPFTDGVPSPIPNLMVVKTKSAQAAHDAVGTKPGSFAWGRFHFYGDAGLLDQVRAALGGR